jgi:hypothetical protein
MIKDQDMLEYLEFQKDRYGSYSAFIRSLIIDRMEGRQKTLYRDEIPVRKTKELIDKNPMPFLSELKSTLESRGMATLK